MKPIITWIAIFDGNKARVLKHSGPGHKLTEVDGLARSQEPLKSGEILADRQGRTFSSQGPGRAAMELPTDPADKREADFAVEFVQVLEEKARDKAFDRLVVAADPQSLGAARAKMSKNLREKIMAELPKDLTRVPDTEIAKHLDGILAV